MDHIYEETIIRLLQDIADELRGISAKLDKDVTNQVTKNLTDQVNQHIHEGNSLKSAK